MSKIVVPFTDAELAGMTFKQDGSDDWSHLFMRAMATLLPTLEVVEAAKALAAKIDPTEFYVGYLGADLEARALRDALEDLR